MRGFRDRDFIESAEGLLFCVVGNVHPMNRIIAYLKYVPWMESPIRVKWSRDGVPYGRILPFYSAMGVKNTLDFLRSNYPHYVVFDEYRSLELIEVPRDRIKGHYKPEERVKEVVEAPQDTLEAMAKELVLRISTVSDVPIDFLGITGSILLKIHNPAISDVDIVVYGKENAYKVKEALIELYSDRASGFSLPYGEVLETWARDIVKTHPLTVEEARLLYSKFKWNRALYKGRQFSVHPVKLEFEVDEVWEHKMCKPLGMATVRAKVVDSSDSIFMPALYRIDGVRVIDGSELAGKASVIVSYEGLYMDLANPGDEIVARGKLEKVNDLRSGEVYYQIVIGTYEARGNEFLKPVKWFKVWP